MEINPCAPARGQLCACVDVMLGNQTKQDGGGNDLQSCWIAKTARVPPSSLCTSGRRYNILLACFTKSVFVQCLHGEARSNLGAPQCQPMMEFQWNQWLALTKKVQSETYNSGSLCCVQQEVGGEAWAYQEPVAVFVGGDLFLGGLPQLLRWAAESFGYRDPLFLSDYQTKATQAYNYHISNTQVCKLYIQTE